MGELFGVPVSPGAVSRMVARITAAPGAPLEAIRQALTAADVAHLDETGFRVAGKLAWVHSASAGKFALITLHAKRGTQGIDAALLRRDRRSRRLGTVRHLPGPGRA